MTLSDGVEPVVRAAAGLPNSELQCGFQPRRNMSISTGASYVYLLRDPRKKDFVKSIFYVGKGSGARPVQHVKEAQKELKALISAPDTSAPQEVKNQLSAKLSLINAIQARGDTIRVDTIAYKNSTGLSTSTAYDIEAALIAVLRMGELSNKVRGHTIGLLPFSVFSAAAAAQLQSLQPGEKAIIVTVNGIWGGTDYAGSLLSASDKDLWANAKGYWKFGKDAAKDIRSAANTNTPSVLIAVTANPNQGKSNLVVGLWELKSAKNGVNGWECIRRPRSAENASTGNLRNRLLHQTLEGSTPKLPMTRPQTFRYHWGSW
jgi:hypothetical protein